MPLKSNVSPQMNASLTPKPLDQITEADFVAHTVWASYDDPDELDLLEALGFEPSQVMSAFEAISTSGEIVFPLPSAAASQPFRYLWLAATVRLPNDRLLVGYRTSACLGIYHDGICYLFNKSLPDLSRENAERLALALGTPAIFPAHVHYSATSMQETFAL